MSVINEYFKEEPRGKLLEKYFNSKKYAETRVCYVIQHRDFDKMVKELLDIDHEIALFEGLSDGSYVSMSEYKNYIEGYFFFGCTWPDIIKVWMGELAGTHASALMDLLVWLNYLPEGEYLIEVSF